ncbi:MAG: hypothetical protein H0T79_13485, partial [Deltaproteobacteria bacterium]|nr:hypothetical protein [Deltaproteobacteria bacterium]
PTRAPLRPAARGRQPPTKLIAKSKPEPVAAPAPAVTTPAPEPAKNCSPPYYFDGAKKIFKPACL